MKVKPYILPVVLCGGFGERLKSHISSPYPKQFTKINSSGSFLQRTIERVQPNQFFDPLLFGSNNHRNLILNSCENAPRACQIFFEPERKNTAFPVLTSALLAKKRKIDFVLVMPSDHLINDVDTFICDVNRAHENLFVTNEPLAYFGIEPSLGSSEYGYIIKDNHYIHFYEKPNVPEASQLINAGALWNSGIFILNVDTFLEDFKGVNRLLFDQVFDVFQSFKSVTSSNPVEFNTLKFKSLPNIAFDKAYCEKTNRGAVMRASFDWMDIGSIETYEKARRLNA